MESPLFLDGMLSEEQILTALQCVDIERRRSLIATSVHIPYTEDHLKLILLDLYLSLLYFGKTQALSPRKISVLLSLTEWHHRQSMHLILSLQRSFDLFKQCLVRHAVHRPPFSSAIFSHVDLQSITEFYTNTYFRFYEMFKSVFVPNHQFYFTSTESPIPVQCPHLPPLAEGDLVQEQEEEEVMRDDNDLGQDKFIVDDPDSSSSSCSDSVNTEEDNEEMELQSAEDLISSTLDKATERIKEMVQQQLGGINVTFKEDKES
ncbi:hypothetical protein P9112_002339 [Eukaryota sp. TZLM1-RC]